MPNTNPFVPDVEYYVPLQDHFASEIREAARSHGYKLSNGHAFEIVAAAHGYRSYASLRADGLMSLDHYARNDVDFDVERARERAIAMESAVAVDFEPIARCLEALYVEATNPDAALAARLARNVCLNADWSSQFGEFAGRTLLSPDDHAACAEVACRDDFQDNMWANPVGVPTIAALAQTDKPLPQDRGYHAISAEFVLNVASYLAAERVEELVARYRVDRDA